MHIFAWLVCEKDRPHFSVGPFYLLKFLGADRTESSRKIDSAGIILQEIWTSRLR